jgi:hypothetical protein
VGSSGPMAGRKSRCRSEVAGRKSRHGSTMAGRKTSRAKQQANGGGEEDQRT